MFITVKYRTLILTALILIAGFMSVAVFFSIRNAEPAAEAAAFTYDKGVLIIDAGHGGLDGGAVGVDGSHESDINLDIALKMRDLAEFLGVNTIMTRERADIDYPDENASIASKKISDQKNRVELIRSYPEAQLISIHQNTYSSASIHGAQVFYRNTEKSRELAESIQAMFNSKLITSGRRVASPVSDDIYLMKKIDCTAVLVECGFMSNPDECSKLASDNYRTKLAMTILSAWFNCQ